MKGKYNTTLSLLLSLLPSSVASADSWEETEGSGTLKRQREEKQRHLDAIRQQAEESMRKEIEAQFQQEAEDRMQRVSKLIFYAHFITYLSLGERRTA